MCDFEGTDGAPFPNLDKGNSIDIGGLYQNPKESSDIMTMMRIAIHPQAHPSLDWPYPASPSSPSGGCNSHAFQDFPLDHGQSGNQDYYSVVPSPSTPVSPTEGITTGATATDVDNSILTSGLPQVSTQPPWFSEQAPIPADCEQINTATTSSAPLTTMATSSQLCLENPPPQLPPVNPAPDHAFTQYDWQNFSNTGVSNTSDLDLNIHAVNLCPTQDFTPVAANDTKYGSGSYMPFPNQTKPLYHDNMNTLDCPPIKVEEESPSLFDYTAPLSFVGNPAVGIDSPVVLSNGTTANGPTFIDPAQTLYQRSGSDAFPAEHDVSCYQSCCDSVGDGTYDDYQDPYCHSRRGSEDYGPLNHLQHSNPFPFLGGQAHRRCFSYPTKPSYGNESGNLAPMQLAQFADIDANQQLRSHDRNAISRLVQSNQSAPLPRPLLDSTSARKALGQRAISAKLGHGASSRVRANHAHHSSLTELGNMKRAIDSKDSASDFGLIPSSLLEADIKVKKRVGKRKGPLKPEQRRQASEIRKLRACLRCKFLKKTCDKGEPCAGCMPAHARLWQVPCTRIDIKDIGFFTKDWKADYAHNGSFDVMRLQRKAQSLHGFSDVEHILFITHGFGHVFPVSARELLINDDSLFRIGWIEDRSPGTTPNHFECSTLKLSTGVERIPTNILSDYLDRHIDTPGTYERFIDDFFTGTPFITEMLRTTFQYYVRTGAPVIRKALKLVLAYNLTSNITMIDNFGEPTKGPDGKFQYQFIDDLRAWEARVHTPNSFIAGRIVAPVMINFAVKAGMAQLWRELQSDVLEDLSKLLNGVYSGEKLKNWPSIFFLGFMLLFVWEEMEFDSNYRLYDEEEVQKFTEDLEGTPLGVIVGMFHAISQKMPALTDWDTEKHGGLFNHNKDICDTLTEVRKHAVKYSEYLRSCKDNNRIFQKNNLDCLANKFIARLIVRVR